MSESGTEVVLEALRGESSQAELCRCHNLSEEQISKWKQQFLENAVSVLVLPDGSAVQRGGGTYCAP